MTIAEWGQIIESDPAERVHKIKAEIYARGPVAATINAIPLKGKLWKKYHLTLFDINLVDTITTH